MFGSVRKKVTRVRQLVLDAGRKKKKAFVLVYNKTHTEMKTV